MSALVLDPPLTTAAVLKAGIRRCHLPWHRMTVLGLLAGSFVGLAGQLYITTVSGGGVDRTAGPVKVLGGVMFSIGLMFMALAGGELFTGNCLLIIAVLAKRIFLREMLRDWVIVYFSNFAGCILMAVWLFMGKLNGYPWGDGGLTATGATTCYIAQSKAHLEWYQILFRSMCANYLVCMALFLAAAAKTASGKILGIIFPITMFAAIGLEHSVANMYFFTMATMLNCKVDSHGYYWLNLLLSTIGNVLGAALLSLGYWTVNLYDTTATLTDVPVDPTSHVSAELHDLSFAAPSYRPALPPRRSEPVEKEVNGGTPCSSAAIVPCPAE